MAMTRIFKPFSSLFPEVQQCIVDEMEPTDRVRFTRCSKLSREEAKRSKNYIYGLGIFGQSKLFIKIKHGPRALHLPFVGYIIRFQKVDGRKFKICENSREIELWREELEESTNLVQYAGEHFKNLMRKYQDKIQHASFGGELFADYDFEIDSMRNLKHLETCGYMNNDQFFSKLQNPLDHLFMILSRKGESVAHCEQIYEVRECVSMYGKRFSYEQVLRFSATAVFIHIGSLTEENVCSIIRSWQNGAINKKNVSYIWNLKRSSFDVSELLRLLGKPHNDSTRFCFEFEIAHNFDVAKKATLRYFNSIVQNQLTFDASSN